jgi:peptidoglycan/LPS O-acetylase OafA/YrhL
MLDVARLVAAYAIIWLHTPQSPVLEASKAIGRFAVPFFVCATILLVFEGVQYDRSRPWGQYVRSRWRRLYVPFLVWSGVYLAFKVVKGIVLPGEPNDYPGIEIFWAGSCYHLWFLPFILVVSLLTFAIARGIAVWPGAWPWMFAAAIVAGVAATVMPLPPSDADGESYSQIVAGALPSVAWGLALALACRRFSTRTLEQPGATLLGILVLVAGTGWVWYVDRSRLAETLAGMGFLVAALSPVRRAFWTRLALGGAMAFDIYLSHILWIKIFQAGGTKAGFAVSWGLDLGVFLAAAIAATMTAEAVREGRREKAEGGRMKAALTRRNRDG